MEIEEKRLFSVLLIEPVQGRSVDSLSAVVDRCLNVVSLLVVQRNQLDMPETPRHTQPQLEASRPFSVWNDS